TQGAEQLQARWPHRRVQLPHGRLKQEEKDAVVEGFRKGQGDVLVCTTGVEGGVDVANASVMVIQNAERLRPAPLAPPRGGGGGVSGGVRRHPSATCCRPSRGDPTPGNAWRCSSGAPMGSSSPRRISSCAARESSWERVRAASPS